jgi:hypothetical protein
VNDDSKYDNIEQLYNSKVRQKAMVRGLPKTVKIKTRFCQYCKTKIEYTVAIWNLAHDLECPKCGEITFYEDVVREACLSCDYYEPNELGTYSKCKDPAIDTGHYHMNEPKCSGYKKTTGVATYNPQTGIKVRPEARGHEN